jgi:hypothetical protein
VRPVQGAPPRSPPPPHHFQEHTITHNAPKPAANDRATQQDMPRHPQRPEASYPLPARGPMHGLVVRYSTAIYTGQADIGDLPPITGDNAVAHAIVAAIHDTVTQDLPGRDWQTVLAWMLQPGVKFHASNYYVHARETGETEHAAVRYATAELIMRYRTHHKL